MAVEIKAPAFPESVADGEVVAWHKGEGESVRRDELLVEIETDKVVMEVVAPSDGVLVTINIQVGSVIEGEVILAIMEPGEIAKDSTLPDSSDSHDVSDSANASSPTMGPAARKLIEEYSIDASEIAGTGKGGRITKEDVVSYQSTQSKNPSLASADVNRVSSGITIPNGPSSERIEKRVPMTRMRARIAERLLQASQQTAMLTTFNEVNMQPVIMLRQKYKEQFEKIHKGTRLGYMGFFVKAACEALKRFPAVNASIDGQDVVYHGYQDIGVAVSTEDGLVVPVLRDADFMSLADIEAAVSDLGLKARDNKLSIEDMTGGTFTVTNGGVFGSLMSTPILNPPQTGILGMHKIQERPMVIDGEIVVLPMMYLALSYDHRLIDGKTAVQFLVAVKNLIEDPARILLQL